MADVVLDRLSAGSIFDVRGVVAVVTGGGTGIGLMISSTLVANGATVYIIGPNQADLDKITKVYNDAAEKTGRPGRMYGLEGDVRKKSEALRLAGEVGQREKHITVLFNNAGILTGRCKRPTTASAAEYVKAYFDEVTEDTFGDCLATNAVGPYWLTFAFLPLLEKWKEYSGGARPFAPQVIITSSMNAWTKDSATAGFSFPYMFSKAAIGQATAALAHELLPLGIRVNAIAPGFFVTQMTSAGTQDEVGQSHATRVPAFEIPCASPPVLPGAQPQLGGTSRDMGSLALFLVANFFVNGETVLIDGGSFLKHPSSY